MLKKRNMKLNYNADIVKERKANIKQMTVDLFSEIEISGYDCSINWFLHLNIIKLQKKDILHLSEVLFIVIK